VKISVVTFDVSDNATGRADLLARLLADRHDVEVVGPQFGALPWAPVQGGPIRQRSVRAARYPGLLTRVHELLALIDGDLIVASKARPTSYGLALLARRQRRRPLLLDIDDWEVGFYHRTGVGGRIGRALNLANPNGLTWTWLVERLVHRADALTVASRFLERRFGGAFIPHARDTDAWDPERLDRDAARAALGVSGRRVVMFLGTPRGHKGVDDLVTAVGRLPDEVVLLLVGTAPERGGAARWAAAPRVRLIGEIPFADVPRHLVAADVVVIPQRATPDTLGQVPAKLFDAMALARPIVSTAVSMIPEILDGCGVVVAPGDVDGLTAATGELLGDPDRARALGERARARCVARYSFAAARRTLFPVIERLVARR
jgi:glycosyltransferase involved in cell wall biosynthesis